MSNLKAEERMKTMKKVEVVKSEDEKRRERYERDANEQLYEALKTMYHNLTLI